MRSTSLPIANKMPVLSFGYSPSLKLLAISQIPDTRTNTTLSIWDVVTRKEVDIIEGNAKNSAGVACFDYRNKFLIYSDREKIFAYNITSRKKHELGMNHENVVRIVSSKSSGRIAISGKHVEVLDIDTGESIWKSEEYKAGEKTNYLAVEGLPVEWNSSKLTYYNEPAVIDILDDGKRILLGGHNKGNIEDIDIESGKVLKRIFPAPMQAYTMSLGFNETILAVSSKIPYANFVWHLESGKRILPEIFNERFGGYSSLNIHPSEKLMVSGSLVGYVSVQNLENGNFIFSKKLHGARVSQVLFSDKLNTVFSASDDGDVRISDLDI
jgi:WD40 repeat protein